MATATCSLCSAPRSRSSWLTLASPISSVSIRRRIGFVAGISGTSFDEAAADTARVAVVMERLDGHAVSLGQVGNGGLCGVHLGAPLLKQFAPVLIVLRQWGRYSVAMRGQTGVLALPQAQDRGLLGLAGHLGFKG